MCVHLAWDVTAHKEVEQRLRGALQSSEYRVHELECLHAVAQLLQTHDTDPKQQLQELVDTIATWWPAHQCCGVRLMLRKQTWTSPDFRSTPAPDLALIQCNGQPVGKLEIHLAHDSANETDDSAPDRNRTLAWLLSDRIGAYLDQLKAAHDLRARQRALEDANSTLRNVLFQINQDRSESEKSVVANIREHLLPPLMRLKDELPRHFQVKLELLERQLADVTSPLTKNLLHQAKTLTTAELAICELIRQGFSTKEIAGIRHVSPATVEKQREQIRRKLKISGTRTNLASYLLQLADRAEEPLAVMSTSHQLRPHRNHTTPAPVALAPKDFFLDVLSGGGAPSPRT